LWDYPERAQTFTYSQFLCCSGVNQLETQPQYVYESNVHAQNILSTLNNQRKCGLLCDMTVIVQVSPFTEFSWL